MTEKKEEFVAHYVMYLDDFFLEDSIESVYPHVDKIIIARTAKPWNGPPADLKETEKTLRTIVNQYGDKIEIYITEFPNEQTQRNWLINFSKSRGHKGAFIIDCDEIFTGNFFKNIYNFIEENHPKALRIPYFNFIKDASFSVAPPYENGLFYVDLAADPQFIWARSCNVEQSFLKYKEPEILHFSYVRKNDEDIIRKIRSFSHAHDIDWEQWFQEVYVNFNPGLQNFHPAHPEMWRKLQLFDPEKFPQRLKRKLQENKKLFYNQFIKDKKSIKLHLGCGSNILNGYINIDLYNQSADIKLDITDLPYFEDNSVEEIFLNAVFEHLYTFEQNRALKEWYRILKPGGLLRIDSLPDFDEIIKAYINKTKGHIKETFDLYEVTRYTHGDYLPENRIGQMHKDLFTKEKIKNLLENAGFVISKIESVCWGHEPNPVNINIIATKGSYEGQTIKYDVKGLYTGIPSSQITTNLLNTTLCCIDCNNYELSILAIKHCLQLCQFSKILFFTDKEFNLENIAVLKIPKITTKEQYSIFVLKELNGYIDTDFVLIIQWDGFIVNPDAWTQEFQNYDYIGAKWPWYNDGFNVGNGGFSLRSKRLLQILSGDKFKISIHSLKYGEDTYICRTYRRFLENEYGIKFAHESVADRFSYERIEPVGNPFGFHGLFNMWRYVKEEEFVNFIQLLHPRTLNSIEAFELAMNYQKLAKVKQAEIICRRILEFYSHNQNAQELLTAIEIQNTRTTEKVLMNIEEVTQSAISHYQAGNFKQAKHNCEEILKVQPDNAKILHLIGLVMYQLGYYDLSIYYIQQAIAFNSQNAELYFDLGNILEDKGQIDEAITNYQRALEIKPAYPEAYNNLGLALYEKGQSDKAIICYQKALKLNPLYYDAYYNLGILYQETENFDEAITCYQKAVEIDPHPPEAYNNLGLALYEKRDIDEAIVYFQRALQINPDYPEAYNNLGNALRIKGQSDEALDCYQKALEINPNYPEAYNNLGNILKEKGNIDEALACFDKALRIQPDFASAHWNKALAFLLSGDFKQGWKEYPWFWRVKGVIPRNYNQPVWDGSNINEARIFLYAEQGFGDTIQFIRYIPLVARRFKEVIIECQEELVSLVKNIKEICIVIPKGEGIPEFDVHCSLLMLPVIFDTSLESIPADVPYITVDPNISLKWHGKLQGDTSQLKIGLGWAGGHTGRTLHERSCSLDLFSVLGEFNNISFYNLQKGEAAEQAKSPLEGMKIIDFMDEISDFEDTAGLIENLDLVISVDTAVAHLAGALGKPVWTLLSYAADWRWMLNRDDSPWYPTMRLFRQLSMGDWKSVIAQVAEELRLLTAKR